MKSLRFISVCVAVVFITWIITNAIVRICKNNIDYKSLLEENNQLNLIQKRECVKYHGLEYCDKIISDGFS